jgi:hypothetical protein
MINKKINYSDPLPMETINEVLANAERVARQLKQQTINTTPPEISKQQTYNTNEMKMTDSKVNPHDEILMGNESTPCMIMSDEIEKMIDKTNMTNKINNTIQTNTPDTNTNDHPPMWKRLAKSFVAMMIVFMFVYAGFNILTWLYDTLGMEHVMPTLIGLALWVAVYDHMYGTASKAPRIN